MTPTTPTTAQILLAEARAIHADTSQILDLARTLTIPMEGAEASFIETVIALLQMIIGGIDQTHRSLEALHQKIDGSGAAAAIEKAMAEE